MKVRFLLGAPAGVPAALPPMPLISRCAVLLLVLCLSACAPLPQRTRLPSTWLGSPNFDHRRPNFIVLHYTGDASARGALATLRSERSQVSAHYLIDRDGTLFQLVDEKARAWHAGDSRWGALTDLNSASIGIELDNDGRTSYPDVQIDTLLRLLADLVERLGIPPANVLGHADIAPRRKIDPGPRFPWATLARAGYGLWCEPPYPPAPRSFETQEGLRILGYDLSQLSAAEQAFKSRFSPAQASSSSGLDANQRALLYCLVQQSRSP